MICRASQRATCAAAFKPLIGKSTALARVQFREKKMKSSAPLEIIVRANPRGIGRQTSGRARVSPRESYRIVRFPGVRMRVYTARNHDARRSTTRFCQCGTQTIEISRISRPSPATARAHARVSEESREGTTVACGGPRVLHAAVTYALSALVRGSH